MKSWWRTTGGLYAIVDPEHCRGRAPLDVAIAILEGGCAVLQLRAKHLTDRALLDLARDIKAQCASKGVPFVLNDRADIAALAKADGLHLGQEDLPVAAARETIGDMCIGVSTHNLDQALRAEQDGADLIGFGPVFLTSTKSDPDPVVGLDGLGEACRRVDLPVVAIGGITHENAPKAISGGARWVAAISSVIGADDVTAAASTLHRAAQD